MAIGTGADLQVYQPFFQAGWFEGVAQNADLFNAASNGTIVMVNQNRIGEFNQEAFWKSISNLFQRVDRTSTDPITPIPMNSGEQIGIKLDNRSQAVSMTGDSWLKIGQNPEAMLFHLGRQLGEEQLLYTLNRAIVALFAAITGTPASIFDATGTASPTLNHTNLARALKTQGDKSGQIEAWLMHGTPWHDLMINSVEDNVFDVAGVTINMGTVASLRRRQIVTDAVALQDTTTTSTADTFHVLGLRQGAIVIENSQAPIIAWEGPITRQEQIFWTYQTEFVFNVKIKGYTWDVSNGGVNPTDSTLGTSSNWDLTVSDQKLAAGCALKVKEDLAA